MSKVTSKAVLMRKWIEGFEDFAVEGEKLFCRPCGNSYGFARKSQFKQHLETSTHKAASQKMGNVRQRTLSELPRQDSQPSEFANELVATLLREGIPLQKLENGSHLRKVLEKHCVKNPIPCLKTIRKTVTSSVYTNVVSAIKSEIEQSQIWCSVDETTDRLGRNIVNVLVGKLDGKKPSKGRLIHVEVVEHTNAATIVQCVQEGLRILWGGAAGTKERLLLFVTDSAAYMLAAGRILKASYPKLLHLTCLSHGLHRLAEAVRDENRDVNKLISSTKKVFLKAPTRVELFRNTLPDVPLPPEPILTRWGTWLSAVKYYVEHLSGIRKVFEFLDSNEAQSIAKAKEALEAPGLETHLVYIHTTFGEVPGVIESFQRHGALLADAVDAIGSLYNEPWSGPVGEKAKTKLENVLHRNPSWKAIRSIAARLKGEEDGDLPEGWTSKDVPLMKYAPCSSADVERSFSKFKMLLNEKRTNLTEENLEQHMVVYFNDI